ncbi:MAG: hypothetical protein KBI14_08410 [Kofleriaceae bacterium]|nr:hypothetical protein [Kofleriaceae bacterium]
MVVRPPLALSTALMALVALLAVAACAEEGPDTPPIDQNGTVGGRVLMTLDGPLVGAAVSIDHTEYQGETIQVRSHVADLVTDDRGAFETLTGTKSGFFIITTRGGSFRDYATGETVVLDEADGLTALLYIDTLEDLTTGLVTPFTHLTHKLIDARTQARLDADLVTSHALVNDHVDRHLGELTWERAAPADLAAPQPSPTAEVRAAFVLGAWSLLAHEIATAAGATVQQVNPYTLARDLGRDAASPPFDGNDGNDRAAGSGLQLAACAPVTPGCAPSGACPLSECRTACDAYAGTLRTGLAAAVTRLINDDGPTGRNQTGLSAADSLGFARAMAGNLDPLLFGDTCAPILDQTPPTITFGPTPAPGALVRGAIALTAVATDDLDSAPVVTLDALTDTDGAPSSAAATLDTTGTDGPLTVTATARDAAGNAATATLALIADNTAPTLTIAPLGFLVDGTTWWTSAASPSLTGTASDLHGPITVRANVLGVEVASTVAGPGGWNLTLPVGAVGPGGAAIELRASDAVGNVSPITAATSPILRVDATPPTVDGLARTFFDEANDAISFPPAGPSHNHLPTGAVTLGTAAPPSCPTLRKYAYLTAVAPGATESGPNPVALAFRAADTGIGVEPAGATYTVTTPGGQTFGPFPVTATPAVGAPGAFDHLADLRRDGPSAVPPIGVPTAVQEGVFTVTFTARDRLGQSASVARCFTYRPMGPPMKVVLQAREAVGNAFVMTLRGDYKLDNTAAADARMAALLNGTASAGILEVWVQNVTPDPAYVTFSAPRPPVPTVSRTLRTHAKPIGVRSVSGPTCDPSAGPLHALCGSAYVPALLPDSVRTNQPMTVAADGPPRVPDGWVPYLGVFEIASSGNVDIDAAPCTGCDPDEYELLPGVRRAVVIGLRGLPDVRPETPGPYAELVTDPAAPPAFRSLTSSYAGVDSERCTRWVAFGPNSVPSCREITTYEQHRYVASAGLTLAPVSAANTTTLEARWTSAARPTFTASSPAALNTIDERRLAAPYTWVTTEN